MPVTINGTTGIAGVDGSAGTPAVQGADSNTGIFFPAADTIAFAEGGAEVARFDSSGNFGIGTSSPTAKIGIPVPEFSASSTAGMIRFQNPNVSADSCIQSFYVASAGSDLWLGANSYVDTSGNTARFNAGYASSFINIRRDGSLQFGTNTSSGVATERARIDSSGNLLVNTTSTIGTTWFNLYGATSSKNGIAIQNSSDTGTIFSLFIRNTAGTTIGSINNNGTNTTFSTSSDYRLKENVQPMTGALAKVAALKPCTYTWKATGASGQGFIAHELAEVVPDAVVGEKDAVEEDGSIKPQGIDTSFLVATLTAAIQEQQALIESLTARIAALEAA